MFAFGLYAAVAAGLLVLNMPPYQNADENNHFLRADNLSRFHLVGHRFEGGRTAGGPASPEIAASGLAFEPPKFHPERRVTLDEYRRSAAKFGAPAADIAFPNTAVYPPPFYAPAVVALWIGRAGRMSVVQTLYLARGLTALAAGAAIAAALALALSAGATGAAVLIFVLATLPMSLSLQSAVTQDGLLLGTSALAAALLARLRQAPRGGELVALCVCLALIGATRPPYALLAFVLLFLPVPWSGRIAAVASAVAAAGLWSAFANREAGVPLLPGVDALAQLRILLDPARTLILVADTLAGQGPDYWSAFIGRLGWLDVALPHWFVRIASAVLALAAVAGVSLRGGVAAGLILAALASSLAVLLAMYAISTTVGGPVIEGVQGRYFLPPALLLAGLGTQLPLLWPGWIVRGAALALPAVGIGVTMRAIVLRYYLWP